MSGQGMIGWSVWILLHLAIGMLGTLAAIRYALHRQLLDQPGERRSHSIATPRGGGISIVASLLAGSLWLASQYSQQRPMLLAFAAGLTLVAAIGWWDDHRPLSPWSRLAVHAVAAGLLAAGMWASGAAPWQSCVVFVLALALVNIWNFMDGINGLAASQAAIAGMGFALLLPGPWSWLAVALAAASAGFLRFNFPKASVFLGDVGSNGLGYTLAMLLGAGLIAAPRVAPPLWLLPMTAFAVDAGFTLLWRILNRQQWWMPHVQHLYQRWARRQGHVRITLIYGLFSLVATSLMVAGGFLSMGRGSALAVGWILVAVWLWWRTHRKQG